MNEIDEIYKTVARKQNLICLGKDYNQYMIALRESPKVFLDLVKVLGDNCKSKNKTEGKKDNQHRVHNFMYEFEGFDVILRTFTPINKGTRPIGHMELEILTDIPELK